MARLRALALQLWPALVYVALAFGVTWGVWRAPMSLVGGGDQPDWTGTIWTYWWTAKALSEGMNPADGTWNFFPVGFRPVAQYNLLDAFLAAPLMLAFGAIRGYNAFAVLALATTGLAMDRLARAAGARWAGALLAGLSLELSTAVSLELYEGRLSQVLLAPMLLAFASLYRLSRGQAGWPTAVGAGVWTALTFLGYWYYGLFLVFGAIPLWLAELRRLDRRRVGLLALAATVTTLICGPLVLKLASAYANLPGVQRPMASELFDYGDYGRGSFTLNMAINQSLWPGWPLLGSTGPADDHRVALALLALGLGGLLLRHPGRWRWFAVAATGYVLALGPYLRDRLGAPQPWRLPYLLLYDHTPLVSRLWWPERFAILAWVGLCVLAALHLDRVLEWLGRRGRALPALGLGLALAAVGWDASARNSFLPPFAEPGRPVTLSVYNRLSGPILTVPVLGSDPSSRYLLWFQLFHGQPILSGLGAHLPGHRPAGYEAYIRSNGLLRALAAASEGQEGGQVVQPSDIQQLRQDGFVWAVVDPMAISGFYRNEQVRAFNEIFFQLWGEADIPRGVTSAWRIAPIKQAVQLPERATRSFTYSREAEIKARSADTRPPAGASQVPHGKRDQRAPRRGPGPLREGEHEPREGRDDDLRDPPGE